MHVVRAPADTVLINGKVSAGTVGAPQQQAVAIAGDRILHVGSNADALALAAPGARLIDAGGRRVIPGLIDSHIHLVRGGLTWDQQLDWTEVTSLAGALATIEEAVRAAPPGTWISVVGGWHPEQFAERRGPDPEELTALAPEHPVYVQLLYERVVLNQAALDACGIDAAFPDPPNGSFEHAPDGAPTGHGRGVGAFQHCLGIIGRPDAEAQVGSTRSLMARLNQLGITGAVDPGGMGMSPEAYRPLYELWRRGEMTVRTRLYLMPSERGRELEQITEYVRHNHPGFGDDLLRVVGIGEILVFGFSDLEGVSPFEVGDEARRTLLDIMLLLARNRWPAHIHAVLDTTISAVLDVLEEADAQVPFGDLRMSLAHAEPISDRNLARVRALGAGIAVQDRMVFRGKDSAAFWGDDVLHRSPPLRSMLDLGIPLGGGTDSTVVSPYDPWLSIWWLVTGRSKDGGAPRGREQCLTREEALQIYTRGSAWFSYDEQERGALEPGLLADLAVLSADLFDIEEDEIPSIAAELTMVGGTIVHDSQQLLVRSVDPAG